MSTYWVDSNTCPSDNCDTDDCKPKLIKKGEFSADVLATASSLYSFPFVERKSHRNKSESAVMDTGPIEGGHIVGGASENAFHPGIVTVQHTEGHTVRQHSGQIESHGSAGAFRTECGR